MNSWFDNPMRLEVLRSEKGGYNKADVLTKLDSLNAILMMLEQGGVPREQLLAGLNAAEEVELRREKGGLFGKHGFSVEDTDAYLEKLMSEIRQKAGL